MQLKVESGSKEKVIRSKTKDIALTTKFRKATNNQCPPRRMGDTIKPHAPLTNSTV